MAVRGGVHDRLGSDISARAGPVLNDALLAEAIRQPLCHQAPYKVRRTTGRGPDDDAYRPRRVGLRPRDPRQGWQRGSARCQMQKLPSVEKFHGFASSGSGRGDTRYVKI